MATTAEIARRCFLALGAPDLDEAAACWRPAGIDRLVGGTELVAADAIRGQPERAAAAAV
jgi:hypothetical protein